MNFYHIIITISSIENVVGGTHHTSIYTLIQESQITSAAFSNERILYTDKSCLLLAK